jgi:hypothetical protein
VFGTDWRTAIPERIGRPFNGGASPQMVMDYESSAGSQGPATLFCEGENAMYTILLILLVLMLIGALPAWPYSSGWGYYPSGGLGLVVIILLVLVLSGRV